EQEGREVGPVAPQPRVLLRRDDDHGLLAPARHHLRAVLQRATDDLAEPLLGLLQLPPHGADSCLVCLDYKAGRPARCGPRASGRGPGSAHSAGPALRWSYWNECSTL